MEPLEERFVSLYFEFGKKAVQGDWTSDRPVDIKTAKSIIIEALDANLGIQKINNKSLTKASLKLRKWFADKSIKPNDWTRDQIVNFGQKAMVIGVKSERDKTHDMNEKFLDLVIKHNL